MQKSTSSDNNLHTGHHGKRPLVINRLSRIEGHIRAIKRMIEEEKPCPEVLIQLAAVRSAVKRAAQVVLEDHVESCLSEAASKGNVDQEWQSLKEALDKYVD